jgi:hypothetical protein
VNIERERARREREPTVWSAIASGLGYAVLLMLIIGAVAFIVGETDLLSDGEAWVIFAAAWIVASAITYTNTRRRFLQRRGPTPGDAEA